MEIDFFCEVAWLKLGKANLAPGAHRLEFRVGKLPDDKGKPQRVLFALDAICVYPGEFRPNGKFKPDVDGRDDHDRQAAETVFRLSDAGPDGARESIALAGQWEICRDDEQAARSRGRADPGLTSTSRTGGPSPSPAIRTRCAPTWSSPIASGIAPASRSPRRQPAGRSSWSSHRTISIQPFMSTASIAASTRTRSPRCKSTSPRGSSRGSTRSGSASATPGMDTRPARATR